jgi:hypothetical protein
MKETASKTRLDSLIAKGRVDLYKPIQIAEVLHKHRILPEHEQFDLNDVESFRNRSRVWRDEVTLRLLSKRSTSSARYQDDIWNASAMPPNLLIPLDRFNQKSGGVVEAYIYQRFAARQGLVSSLIAELKNAQPSSFCIARFLGKFESEPGLRRSIDKGYEIVTFAILDLLIRKSGAAISLVIPEHGRSILGDFVGMGERVFGVPRHGQSASVRARIYRVGVTNAADRGLDMWANFGPAIQVKHLRLDAALAVDIVGQLDADRVVVVCKDADAAALTQIMTKLPVSPRIGGVIQQHDLIEWYERALRGPHNKILAADLIDSLVKCFESEFPQATEVMTAFMQERGYDRIALGGDWEL